MISEVQWLKAFGNCLTHKMRDSRTTQKELSEWTGIARSTISKYMKGEQMPTAYSVVRLADFFDVFPSELIDFEYFR